MAIRPATILVLLCVLAPFVGARDRSDGSITIQWPNTSSPTLKLTFEKFTQLTLYEGQRSLQSHVLVENVSSKPIPQASFTVYLIDKDRVRIGNGILSVNDLEPNQQVRLSFQVFSVGIPATLALAARNNPLGVPTSLKTLPIKVISIPPGAALKADGHDVGVTPTIVNLAVGGHTLEFSKEGFAAGSTPIDVKPDEGAGGSVTFELGGLSHDSVELWDGTKLEGDAISMSMLQVIVRVNGVDQAYDRNRVKKITLVQRETVQQPAVNLPVTSPQP